MSKYCNGSECETLGCVECISKSLCNQATVSPASRTQRAKLQDTRAQSKDYFEQKRLRIEAQENAKATSKLLDRAMQSNKQLQSICDEQEQRVENLHAYLHEIEMCLYEQFGITAEQLIGLEDAQASI